MIPVGVPFEDVLKELVAKSPKDLTEEEIGFLKARKFYLTPGELNKFKSVLGISKK